MNEFEVTTKSEHGYYYADSCEQIQERDGSITAHFFRGRREIARVENVLDVKETPMFTKLEYRQAKEFLRCSQAEVVRKMSDPTIINITWRINGELWMESESLLEAPEDRYSLCRLKTAAIL